MQSLEALYEDYEAAIRIQNRTIAAFRGRLNKAQTQIDFKQIQKLNAQLRILYEEKSELLERAAALRSYLESIDKRAG